MDSTALATWDEELAKMAAAAVEQEATTAPAAPFFSLRAGQIVRDGKAMPDNQLAVVVVDSILENAYYPEAYDPDSPQPPSCYAFGRCEAGMAPHCNSLAKQAETCADCPLNQWNSAPKGRGKACRNRRRLALIPAGSLVREVFTPIAAADEVTSAEVVYLTVPPTSISAFGTYVKALAATTRRPPHAVFTKIKATPDAKSQFRLKFEALGVTPNELLPALLKRRAEVQAVIEFPYPKPSARDAAQAPRLRKF